MSNNNSFRKTTINELLSTFQLLENKLSKVNFFGAFDESSNRMEKYIVNAYRLYEKDMLDLLQFKNNILKFWRNNNRVFEKSTIILAIAAIAVDDADPEKLLRFVNTVFDKPLFEHIRIFAVRKAFILAADDNLTYADFQKIFDEVDQSLTLDDTMKRKHKHTLVLEFMNLVNYKEVTVVDNIPVLLWLEMTDFENLFERPKEQDNELTWMLLGHRRQQSELVLEDLSFMNQLLEAQKNSKVSYSFDKVSV